MKQTNMNVNDENHFFFFLYSVKSNELLHIEDEERILLISRNDNFKMTSDQFKFIRN